MAEYVTKEQVIDWYRPYGHTDEPIQFETLVSDLRDMKTADVSQVRHGRWLCVDTDTEQFFLCNRCKKKETLKQGLKRTPCTCYKVVHLWKDGRYYTKYVHRLIAEAFIPNPENLEFINHKDEDGTNNDIENLEWCTREYNVNYGTALSRMAKKIRGRESEKRIPVYATDEDGNFAGEWPSITSAANDVGCATSDISKACKGKRKTAKGYIWSYCNSKMDLEG